MKPTHEDLLNLLDFPKQLHALEKTLNGLKSDKVKLQRKQNAIEARLRLSDAVKVEKNDPDRKAAFVLACDAHADWTKNEERLEALNGMIRATEAQRDLLRRKRAGIQVNATHHLVERLEEVVKDKELARQVGLGHPA